MTEADLLASPQATPFAALLESAAAPHQLANYRGVLTPQELDAPEAEIAALAAGAACHDMGWLRRVAVRGEDRFRWLSGMVTNTVEGLGTNAGAWNLVLNAQGRIQGDLTVWREGETLELEIAADQYERLLAHLERFIVMDDVELVPLSGETALGLTGPAADELLARVGLPVLSEQMTSTRAEFNGMDLRIARGYGQLAAHYTLWAPEAQPHLGWLWKFLRTAGATPVGSISLDAFRIAEGIPVYGVDMVERDLPQETAQLRALHFSKGCYLGQEIVERIRSRGNVHRHLRPLELSGPVPATGTELALEGGGTAIGHITSAATLQLPSGPRTFALAMIRGEAELNNQLFTYHAGSDPGTARVLAAPPSLQ
ncbi:MAG: folate-binding protein [Terracidiphilus sp.]|nr:folate-binding protein [Terracidiphilus sp.]